MKKIIDYIIKNDLYQVIFYTIDGEDLIEKDYNNILNGDFEIIHQQEILTIRSENQTTSEKVLILFNLITNFNMIELYIEKNKYIEVLRDFKIKLILDLVD